MPTYEGSVPEAVDALAKHECQHQLYVPRQSLHMPDWGKIPHLWLCLGDPRGLGLPTFTRYGFDIHPIDLPQPEAVIDPTPQVKPMPANCEFQISWGTYNVRSLYRGPEGHAWT